MPFVCGNRNLAQTNSWDRIDQVDALWVVGGSSFILESGNDFCWKAQTDGCLE